MSEELTALFLFVVVAVLIYWPMIINAILNEFERKD